jgi:hypothetical protein
MLWCIEACPESCVWFTYLEVLWCWGCDCQKWIGPIVFWLSVIYLNKRFSCHYSTRRGKQGSNWNLRITRAHLYHWLTYRGGESACVMVRIKGDESRHITFCNHCPIKPGFSKWQFWGAGCNFLCCFAIAVVETRFKTPLLQPYS